MNENIRLFVVSCYYDGSNEAIFNCTNSILNFYENPKIVVVDSDSPNKTYYEKLKSKSIEILDVKNKNYDTGAYWIAFNKYDYFENYYFLQDSVRFKRNLANHEKNDFTSFRYSHSIDKVGGFKIDKTKKKFLTKLYDLLTKKPKIHDIYGFDSEEQLNWCRAQLRKTNYFFPKTWLNLFGPIFFCKNKVMKSLKNNNFNYILPTNKLEQMGMERLFGIALQQNGFDVSNSIQGENFSTPYNTEDFEKTFFKRK